MTRARPAEGSHRSSVGGPLVTSRDWAVECGYRASARVAAMLPAGLVAPVAALAGRCAATTMRRQRRLVAHHLGRVEGGDLTGHARRQAVTAAFASYARYWLETFRLPRQPAAEIAVAMGTEGVELLDAALHEGRGAILAVPHLGGFDAGAAWLAATGRPVTTVAERVRPARLFDWFVAQRGALGVEVIAHSAGALDVLRHALAAGRVVALVCDRDLGRRGVEVDFFGERTTLPTGPARLALETGAPLLPAAVYFAGSGHRAVVRPPIPARPSGRFRDDIARVTQRVAHELEALIRVAPEQWHLMVPNWPSDP